MKILLVLFSAFIMNACACQKTTAENNMKNEFTKSQNSENLAGDYTVQFLSDNDMSSRKVTLNFNPETNIVSGFSGCNNFSGTYIEKKGKVSFSKIITTEKYCEDASKVETNFLQVLHETTKYELKESVLILQSDNAELLKAKSNSKKTKIVQEGDQVIYTASTRGVFFEAKLIGNELFVIKVRGGKATTLNISNKEVAEVEKLMSEINLETINALEAPTSLRTHDAAAHANISITKNGQNYKSSFFDAGHAPKELEALVNKIISLSQKK